jgi:hypothetical protein
MRKPVILDLMRQRTGLQYSSAERHREAASFDAIVWSRWVTKFVVPKGNVADSGKTINRRYLNVYFFEDGRWRPVGRQATNVSVG